MKPFVVLMGTKEYHVMRVDKKEVFLAEALTPQIA